MPATRTTTAVLLPIALLTCHGCAAAGMDPDKGFLDPTDLPGAPAMLAKRANPMARTLAPARANAPAAPVAAVAAPSDAAAPPPPPAQDARLVVYSAGFRVVVADVPGTLRAIQLGAERLGGHLQEISGSSITVRVPAARFDDAVALVERVGEVVDRQVKAQDVTEEMRDLRIRLDNAERLRERLVALLQKADKVEDAIKIEAELARVSEQLDAVKGKIRFMESQIAMSTVRVELNSPVPQNARGTGPALPFDWVHGLGEGLVEGRVQQSVRRAGFFARGPRFDPPAGFVRYYEDKDWAEAMDAAGLMVRVQRHRNVDKAPLAFWSKLVRRALVENRSLAVTEEYNDGEGAFMLSGTREVGGQPVGYLVAVERSNRDVIVFEAWGPQDLFGQSLPALRASAESIDPG